MDQRKSVGMLSKGFLYRQRLGYGLGDFACNLIWQVISLYLLYFYTDVVHLGAKSIAVMFMICRVIDAITDVLVGFAIDKTKTRWGKADLGSCLGQFHLLWLRFWLLVCRIFRRMESYSMLTQLTFFYHLCIRWSIFLWHRFCRL